MLDYENAPNEESTASDDKLREVHRRFMRRFDEVSSDQQECRALSLSARRFLTIPGAQWDGEWGEQFAHAVKVESDKLRKIAGKIENDYRENRIVPDFRPDGPQASPETADTLDGMHRADSYRFKSQQARDNAVFEAIAGGFGAYRLANEYEDESDPDNDYQRINPASIITDADQCVYFDGNARLYDKADAKWALIRVSLSREAFAEEWGDNQTEWPEGAQATWKVNDWFQPDNTALAEAYEVEERDEKLHILTHKMSGETKRVWASELEEGDLAEYRRDGWRVKAQTRKRKRVHKYILSGAEVMKDCGYIAGPNIPIVPVYGRRYFVDGMERWEGCVQSKMDDQRLHNMVLSRLGEITSLSPREVPIFAPEQMVGNLGQQWADMNIERKAYALVEPIRDDAGNVVQMGPIGYVKPPEVPMALTGIIQYTSNSLMEDYQDGADTAKANTSAEAMDIAATRVDAKSGIYMDNIAQSMKREGEIYIGMTPDVYFEEGRAVETMTEDGDDGVAKLQQMVAGGKVINDFRSAKYKVIVSVTEATATRRDKTVRSMMTIADVATKVGDQEMAQAALLTAVMNTDGEGSDDFIKWARQRALSIGLVQPNEDEQAAIDAASENEQPDPSQALIEAQTAALAGEAEERAAKVVDIQASAQKKQAETAKIAQEIGLTARGLQTPG